VTDVSKITASHRERLCLVYVRQSTLAQTRANTESLERQYELAGQAVTLGWAREQVRVVDADLGRSGADAAGREGFQHLVSEVALGRVGLIIGLEASRLARSNSDWYQLLDLCGMTGTLIADGDGIYDPSAYSDRLVLGLSAPARAPSGTSWNEPARLPRRSLTTRYLPITDSVCMGGR